IIVSSVLAILMGGLIGVIKYRPDLLGIKDNKDTTKIQKVDKPKKIIKPLKSVYIEPTVQISKKQLAFFENEVIKKNELSIKIESLVRIERYLRDSLKNIAETIRFHQDSVKRANSIAEKSEKDAKDLQDSLIKKEIEIKKLTEKYSLAQKRIENYQKMLEERIDSSAKINFEVFAKIYENSKPQEVAAILERLDERDAARILKMMNKKKAGKIIEAMKPENAAAILLLGIGQ
ncbi:MAG: hypothetical protein N3A61_02690, partial [Ignavibacteria bacterium]|nr:hypothetical protein [Ignavibacteria bacterium]